MLVLSRKKNETVVIDGRIKIEVLKVKGNTIRLGISAPRDVKVLRGELAAFEDASEAPQPTKTLKASAESEHSTAATSFDIELQDAALAHLNHVASGCDSGADPQQVLLVETMATPDLTVECEDVTRLPNPFAVAQAI